MVDRVEGGERGEKLSPSHAGSEASSELRSQSAESSDLSSRGIRGVSIKCAWCKGTYIPNQPAGSYHPDSDGMCEPCAAKFAAELNRSQVLPAVSVIPPADAGSQAWGYTKAFLTGLGFEPLPGAVWHD